MNTPSFFIDGAWAEPTSAGASPVILVISANSENVIGEIALASPADVDAAVSAARRAFDLEGGWRDWTPARRAEALRRFAGALQSRTDRIAPLISDQMGMPIGLATGSDTQVPIWLLYYYADLIENEATSDVRDSATGGKTEVLRVPRGVVAAIAPWNYPSAMSALKYVPALAAGCTVVLKPSPETALDALLVAEAALEAELPAGVLNIIPADREVGAYLVAHSGVDQVSFTGSTDAGRRIAAACAPLLRPIDLELGGKSASIILDDADFSDEQVRAAFTTAMFENNGQTCYLTSRILAPRSRYDEIVTLVAEIAASLKVGSSLDTSSQVGPLASSKQRDRVEALIASAVESGARLVQGGGRPAGLDRGWFVEPTVFADVDNSWPIAQEEIFGPVVTITPYDDDDAAVALANDSRFGLAGTVWSSNPERARAVARRISAGVVGINGYVPDIKSPMTGVKDSGYGVKAGPEGLDVYRRFQSIYL